MNFEFSNLPGLPVVPNDFGESSALMSGNSVPQWYGAEGSMSDEEVIAILTEVEKSDRGVYDKYPVEHVRMAMSLVNQRPSLKAWAQKTYSADTTFIKWFEESEGPYCWTCGKENPQGHFEGVDNICEPCESKWIYDEGGPEGEGYYLVSALNEEQKNHFKMDAETFEAPMPFYPPSKGDVDRVQKAIRSRHQGIRFKGSPTYLTERKDGSNKYHVFQMTNRGGFNGYGRIGHTMSLFGPMSPQQYQSKLKSKMRKGYRETGF